MKVIIVGLGRTGMLLLGSLAREEYDIVVIDKDQDLVEHVTDKYNVNGVWGSGASRDTLLAAGADTADAIIALAHADEVNLLACMRAKNMGTRYAAARVLEKDLVKEAESIRKDYNIDDIVTPFYDVAEEIYENMGLPGFAKIGGSFGGDLRVYNMNVHDYSVLAGLTIKEIMASCEGKIRFACVLRENRFFIPDDDFVIEIADNLTILTVKGPHQEAMETLSVVRSKVKNIAVVGGGVISEYFLEKVGNGKYNVNVFESDPDVCISLMNRFPKCTIHYTGDDTINVLDEKKVGKVDMLVSATNKDEDNLIISMYAWSSKVPSVLTHMDNPEHVKLLHKVNIDITVSAAESCVLKCMRFLRNHESADSPQKIGSFYFAARGEAEIAELIAGKSFPKLDTPFWKTGFRIRKGVVPLAILRGNDIIVVDEDTSIHEGDRVIVAAKRKLHLRSLNEIIAGYREDRF